MEINGALELCVLGDRAEPPVCANMVREIAAQEIVQVPPRQPREKIARKDAVLLDGRQSGESRPDIFRGWTEQAR